MTRYTTHGRGWTQQRELARGMRHEPTPAEDLLWERLRSRRLLGFKFRRQHPIGRFIVDFYCIDAGLAIEVDGEVHGSQHESDAARQEFLEARGISFLRVTNEEVRVNIEPVVTAIAARLQTVSSSSPPSPRRGEGAGGEVRAQHLSNESETRT